MYAIAFEFYNTQGSVYLTEKNDMANLFGFAHLLR